MNKIITDASGNSTSKYTNSNITSYQIVTRGNIILIIAYTEILLLISADHTMYIAILWLSIVEEIEANRKLQL